MLTLDADEKDKLYALLKRYEPLFDGSLGHWRGELYHIETKTGAVPYHARPYPIPKAYEQTLRMEVDQLVKEGVLKKVNPLRMGSTHLHNPQKGWISQVHIGFQRVKQEDNSETLSNTKNTRPHAETRRIQIWNIIGSKHGILSYQTRPIFKKVMHNRATLGKV